jgi:uncharacterized NAD(P)/FAD-binding protein YdhS
MQSVAEEEQIPEAFNSTVAIVGGGFTGAMLAVQLLRRARAGDRAVLIERKPVLGQGVAYATQIGGHLLNVRAKNMSAYPDVPDHFAKWAQKNFSVHVKPDDFLPRALYGKYIFSQFHGAIQAHPDKIRCIQDDCVSLERLGGVAKLGLGSGRTVTAGKVILALGHFPPCDLFLPGKTSDSSRFVSNPWSQNSCSDLKSDDSVLLIGSGLTSVDAVIELRARGFEGTIHILSRRGLLPKSHKTVAPLPSFWSSNHPRTVRELLRLIRLQIKAAEARGSDWRAVIDSLRPSTQETWRSLPRNEQRRFLRHLRTYWDVHRHRIAEQIAEGLAGQLQEGKIRMHAGRVTEYREDGAGVDIAYRSRQRRETMSLRVAKVFNCTGPDNDYRRVGSPLLSDLMGKKFARPDELSLGLDVSDDGALLDAEGTPSDFLYAVGPLRKGNLWETIAVPEIRNQVSDLAKLLRADHTPRQGEASTLPVETHLLTPLYR